MEIAGQPPQRADRMAELRARSQELEQVFLSEMLRHAGPQGEDGPMGSGRAGGQFASFLRDAQADAMMRGGGIGLARQLFEALAERPAE